MLYRRETPSPILPIFSMWHKNSRKRFMHDKNILKNIAEIGVGLIEL